MKNGNLLPDLFNGMDRFFADLQPYSSGLDRGSWARFAVCDIEETDTHFRMHFDVPGVRKEDVNIELNGRELRVSGERKWSQEDSQKSNFHRRERAWGRFERRFQLGDDADLEKVEAKFQDGVLTINVEKKQSLKPRQITIK